MEIQSMKANKEETVKRIEAIAKQTKCKPNVRAYMDYLFLSDQHSERDGWVTVSLRFLDLYHDNSNWQLTQLLNKLPGTVEEIYDRFLCSVSKEKREVVCRLLLIVLGSRRPLSCSELRILLSVRACHRTVGQLERACRASGALNFKELLGPMVQFRRGKMELIDETARLYMLGLAHDSTNELCMFFGIGETEAEELMAEACMSYLLIDGIDDLDHRLMEIKCRVYSGTGEADNVDLDGFDDWIDMSSNVLFIDGMKKIVFSKRALVPPYTLFDYASRYWASHLSKFFNASAVNLFPLGMALSKPASGVLYSWLSNYWSQTHAEEPYPSDAGPIFVTSFFGHLVSLNLCLKEEKFDSRHFEKAFYWASKNGHDTVVRLLLQKGLKPSIAVNGKFPQHIAAERGNVNILRLFNADDNVDMNVTYQGRTPISLAAGAGHTAAVALLLSSYRVLPDLPDQNGMTALFWASSKNHTCCAAALLASLRVKSWHTDRSGRTALAIAATQGHLDMVNLFLQFPGAGKDLSDAFGRSPLSYADTAGHTSCVTVPLRCSHIDTRLLDSNDRSSFHEAAEYAHVNIAKELLAHSLSPADLPGNKGRVSLAGATDARQGKRVEMSCLLPMRDVREANYRDYEFAIFYFVDAISAWICSTLWLSVA